MRGPESGWRVSRQALVSLYRMAREARLDELAGLAIVEAIRSRRGPLPLYDDLQPLLHSLGQSEQQSTLLEIAAIYLGFEPFSPLVLAHYAYLAYLLDTVAPSNLLPLLEKMAAAFPKEFPVHLTLAAVLLSDGQPAKAAGVLAPFDLENQELLPASRAVLLASEFLNGRIPDEDPRIRDFPWDALSVAERRKFSAMLRPNKGP